mmetsp:Transcript_118089/g.286510  ORF Transcript_118089/g.286510 Transcript_118089/m.286510 type:complete len:215 (-) Transcript_118089:589-1233(-)
MPAEAGQPSGGDDDYRRSDQHDQRERGHDVGEHDQHDHHCRQHRDSSQLSPRYTDVHRDGRGRGDHGSRQCDDDNFGGRGGHARRRHGHHHLDHDSRGHHGHDFLAQLRPDHRSGECEQPLDHSCRWNGRSGGRGQRHRGVARRVRHRLDHDHVNCNLHYNCDSNHKHHSHHNHDNRYNHYNHAPHHSYNSHHSDNPHHNCNHFKRLSHLHHEN